MLNKKSVKILSIVLLAIVLLISFANIAFATVNIPEVGSVDPGESANATIGLVFGAIQYGGIIVAVIMAMYIGIKYITSSPEGKADVKKTLAYYIGGIVLLLSASTIVGAIQTNFTK